MRRPRLTGSVVPVRSRPVRALVVAAFLAVGFGVLVPAAAAHAKLLGASPRPGATVGGTFTTYDVLLDQAALELHEMSLQTESARELPGSWEQVAPNLLRFTADQPLREEGNYILGYRVTVQDGDTTRSAFMFRYEPGAPPPVAVRAADVMPNRSPVLPVAIGAVATAGLALVVVSFVRSR